MTADILYKFYTSQESCMAFIYHMPLRMDSFLSSIQQEANDLICTINLVGHKIEDIARSLSGKFQDHLSQTRAPFIRWVKLVTLVKETKSLNN